MGLPNKAEIRGKIKKAKGTVKRILGTRWAIEGWKTTASPTAAKGVSKRR